MTDSLVVGGWCRCGRVVGIGPDRDTDDSDRESEEEHLRITITSYIVEFRLELQTDENGERQRRYGNSTLGRQPVLGLVSPAIRGWNSFINSYSP